jgi:hypothetical protein
MDHGKRDSGAFDARSVDGKAARDLPACPKP